MEQGTVSTPLELFVAVLVVVAVFGAICVVAWPWLAPRPETDRLRRVLRRQSVADTARQHKVPEKEAHLVAQAKPSRLLERVVRIFKTSRAEDDRLVLALSTAGHRGRAAVVKYMAARIVCPIAFFVPSVFYVFVLVDLRQPLVVELAIVGAMAAVGYLLPGLVLKSQIAARQKQISRAWPDAVDLLLICVETGMSIEHGFRKVAEEMAGNSLELAKELSLTTAELAYQQERRTAYENLASRTALEAVKAVTTCLIQSEKYGTSLGVSLRVLAQESRDMRMAAAEKKAAALPPKLTVPMILFFLPVLFAVIVTPAVLQVSAN